CRASTAAEYERMFRKWVIPKLGRLRVADVTRADVARLHHAMKERPYRANRTAALLSKMFAVADGWGLRPNLSNPVRSIDRYRETRRERFLSPVELARLGDVLRSAEREGAATLKPAPFAVEAIRLLLLTGCRKSEVLRMRW